MDSSTVGRLARPLAPATVALALALLLGLQPLTTDLYLPTLPLLAKALAAPMTAVQLTMSALILAFGLSQLVWGPVSDRVGRRPVLLGGLAAYTAASAAAALAASIELLIAARVVQGGALACAVVCARAMVRDLYEPHDGARVMSQGMSGLGLIAVCGPALGGALAATLGWRSALAAVALAGAGIWCFVWLALPETTRRRDPHATRLAPLLANARHVLTHKTFLAWNGLTSASYGGLFVVLGASSFVYMETLGLSPAAYGVALGSNAFAYLVGTFICRAWLLRHGLRGAVRRGAWFTLAGGTGIVALHLGGVQAVWAVLVPQWLFALGHGVHQPCAQTGAVGPFPHCAGVASALAGFMLSLVAFATGLWLGEAMDGTVRPMAFGMGFWAFVTAALAWTAVQRHGGAR